MTPGIFPRLENCRMKTQWLNPDDSAWRAVLDRLPHDVYHTPAYCALTARSEQGEPIAFHYAESGRELLLPLLVRNLPDALDAPSDWRDATSPYGYPGPLVSSAADTAFIARAIEAFRQSARERRIVSCFVRLHPLLSPPIDALDDSDVELLEHGPVVYLDLTLSEEDQQRQMRSNHRRYIRRLASDGYLPAFDEWSFYGDFQAMYRQTMERVGAKEFYFFPETYFDDARRELADSIHLAMILAPDGRPACGGIFFETAGLIQYHLGATAEEHLAVGPSKLLFDAVRRWGRERNDRQLMLGGGLGAARDSLFHFKAGFSNLDAPFRSLRIIADREQYDALDRHCTLRFPEIVRNATFFPSYRQIGSAA